MSRSPIGSSEPVSSPRKTWRRRARTAPRVWMPTIARRSESGFFSAISWAIRRSVRLRSSCSSTTFSFISVASFLASRDRVKGRGQRSSGSGVVRFPGSILDELGFSSLREGEFDDVEVFGGDGGLEDVAGLFDHLAYVVPGGDVDEGEQLYVGLVGDGGGLGDGRVAGLGGALDLRLGEGGVVDQEVGVGCGGDGRGAGGVVPVNHDRGPGPPRAHHRVGGKVALVALDFSPRCSAA